MSGTSVTELSVLYGSKSVYRLILVQLVNDVCTVASLVRTFYPFFETITLFLQQILSLMEELHQAGLFVYLHGQDLAFKSYSR